MTKYSDKIIQWGALLTALFIAVQMATIILSGEGFCLNQGCEVVESLTKVPPFFINLAGLLFLLACLSLPAGYKADPIQS